MAHDYSRLIMQQIIDDYYQCDLFSTVANRIPLEGLEPSLVTYSSQLPNCAHLSVADFKRVICQMFEDNIINWGRILVMYMFANNYSTIHPGETSKVRECTRLILWKFQPLLMSIDHDAMVALEQRGV